ncbi:hypothetical protein TGRUB_245746B [Toxoplasma gondii RUB]|uniref:Uncharacterized protein n=1 Tax=Toxoplasma gondii RUB TaxID=935652 RepID=A0A086M6X3_TOXGO|nr:hypothetical protein TGRUB_245746B [Toxoplasma gondii RUB]
MRFNMQVYSLARLRDEVRERLSAGVYVLCASLRELHAAEAEKAKLGRRREGGGETDGCSPGTAEKEPEETESRSRILRVGEYVLATVETLMGATGGGGDEQSRKAELAEKRQSEKAEEPKDDDLSLAFPECTMTRLTKEDLLLFLRKQRPSSRWGGSSVAASASPPAAVRAEWKADDLQALVETLLSEGETVSFPGLKALLSDLYSSRRYGLPTRAGEQQSSDPRRPAEEILIPEVSSDLANAGASSRWGRAGRREHRASPLTQTEAEELRLLLGEAQRRSESHREEASSKRGRSAAFARGMRNDLTKEELTAACLRFQSAARRSQPTETRSDALALQIRHLLERMCTELVEFDEKLSRLHAERGGLLELSKLADLQHLVRLFSFFIQWKKKDEAVNAETRYSLTYYVSPKFRRVVSSLLSFSCLAKRIMTAGLR